MNNIVLYKTEHSIIDYIDEFYIIKLKQNKWIIVESSFSIRSADKARKTLMRHDLINGHVTSSKDYQIIKKGSNTVIELGD